MPAVRHRVQNADSLFAGPIETTVSKQSIKGALALMRNPARGFRTLNMKTE